MADWALKSISQEDFKKHVQECMDHYGINLDSWPAEEFMEFGLFAIARDISYKILQIDEEEILA